ncbi:hypothetical protein BDZ91DRAFT_699232 [Kalaharituber pfeilii]|nr:hypothetical protein BDZ91DRAFT_699232 [Kalaharituber pfeilii]
MAKRHRRDSLPSPPTAGTIVTQPSASVASPTSPASSTTSDATSKKYNRLDPKQLPRTPPVITCNFLPTCNHTPFSSYAEFESHYSQQHTNRCVECNRNFPSERYLSIHIAENHDVFVELKKEAGEKTYACFVDGCDRLCSTPQKRRLHVIDKHGFPKDFYFRVVDYGIDNCNSLLRTPRKYPNNNNNNNNNSNKQQNTSPKSPSKQTETAAPTSHHLAGKSKEEDVMQVEADRDDNEPVEDHAKVRVRASKKPPTTRGGRGRKPETSNADKEMADVTAMMASVKLVPRSIRFGRGGGHGAVGFAPRKG